MLLIRSCGAALVFLAASVSPACHLVAGEPAPDKQIASASTEALVALVDEIDFIDPIEANHRLAIRAINELLRRDITGEQHAAAQFRLAVYHLRTDARDAALKADVDIGGIGCDGAVEQRQGFL